MSATPTAADRARAWLIELGDDPDSGFAPCGDEPQESDVESLARVIAEAVAHERERALRACDVVRERHIAAAEETDHERQRFGHQASVIAAAMCAAAIRGGESA